MMGFTQDLDSLLEEYGPQKLPERWGGHLRTDQVVDAVLCKLDERYSNVANFRLEPVD